MGRDLGSARLSRGRLSIWHTKQRKIFWIVHKRKRKGGTGSKETNGYDSRNGNLFISVKWNKICVVR